MNLPLHKWLYGPVYSYVRKSENVAALEQKPIAQSAFFTVTNCSVSVLFGNDA